MARGLVVKTYKVMLFMLLGFENFCNHPLESSLSVQFATIECSFVNKMLRGLLYDIDFSAHSMLKQWSFECVMGKYITLTRIVIPLTLVFKVITP